MNKRTAGLGIGAVVAATIAAGGIAVATSSDDGGSVTGPEASEATAAALRETGGGTANSVELDDEDGAVWEVEVTRTDGTTVDVRMDANYEVVVVDSDDESESDDSDSEPDDDNDLWEFGDSDESDDAEEDVTAAEASQATAAALKATKGGTADDVERDDENGAAYEVEVTRADGSEVDVRLDKNYQVVVMDEESDETD
jgi:uncharacterized membrane protein YkoI